MNFIATVVLIAWLPLIMPLFGVVPPRRAVIVASIVAWLFLPVAEFKLPVLSDYSKITATTLALLLGTMIFDGYRLLGLRLRGFDLPMLAWCTCPFASSIVSGLGAYDGLSASIGQTVAWGLPYLIGRTYFSDLDGLRELAVGIVVGGLIYVPLCLWEIRMSPRLHEIVYGFAASDFAMTIRFGGYRPLVFMKHGLELGMWMTAASLSGIWLWASGSLKQIRGIPFGPLLIVLTITTLFCKSTGSLVLLAVGVALSIAIKWTRSRIPVVLLLAISPLYVSTRAMGLWSGAEMMELVRATTGADREQSLQFRIDNENLLLAKALQRPVFGWGGWGRARVYDEEGRDISITDGLWIIALGNHGLVGLAALYAFMLMPLVVLLKQFPVERWLLPDVAPAAVLAVLAALYSIDCLMNAMLNPIYILAIGGLTALGNRSVVDRVEPQDGPDAEEESIESPNSSSHEPWHANEEESVLLDAVKLQNQRAMDHPEVSEHRRDMALSYEALGRFLKDHGRAREAQAAWGQALDQWAALTTQHPDRSEYRSGLADAQNNLAWLLARAPDVENRNPSLAVRLAQTAVENSPERAAYWNTLGAAHYRAGDWLAAIAALERSVELSSGGSGFDFLLMALIYWQRGDKGRARGWYKRGEMSMNKKFEECGDLARLRHEAAVLLCRRSIDVRDQGRGCRD